MSGDLCKHLGIDTSTDYPDQYLNLFLNAYINRHVHAQIDVYIYQCVLGKKEDKDRESIQSSTTPGPGYQLK